ncbi:MAG: heavy metal translocating P-type ATPase [Gammaproteobacteria bacterium]|nr:heavy metal translocating P-type ATPase [Gammaproteobacteria bacterium]
MTECFHCGLPTPRGVDLSVTIDGEPRPMCCHGCQAVAQAILDAGHGDFYERRTARPLARAEPVPGSVFPATAYDNPDVQAKFVDSNDEGTCRVSLVVDGITCSACAWLIEHRLRETPGVVDAYVNYNTHRAELAWHPEQVRLSEILQRIRTIGYRALPFDPAIHQDIARRENRAFLLRIGVTGALGMQLMMIATAMYFGDGHGMDAGHRELFRWLSLFLAIPIVAYCAMPFFHGALRDLGNRTLGMDVPVSLGLGIAFGGSVWATWTGSGSVYYESVAMFVFLLLGARYLESRARHRSIATIEAMSLSMPDLAERRNDRGDWDPVLASELVTGDIVRVQPGCAFPADGTVSEGATAANESLLTGESTPIEKTSGSAVLAGSTNIDQPVLIQVSRSHGNSTVSQIIRLTDRAQAYKPRFALLADRAAAWFIGGVLLLAAGAGIYWYTRGDPEWLAVVVSILVITCPCALSLATPAALTAAVNTLAGRSVVPVSGTALESLPRIDTMMLDKTGTLTEGRLSVGEIVRHSDATEEEILRIAASLNQSSGHPVARAIRERWDQPVLPVSEGHHEAGGVSGVVAGTRYYIGNATYIRNRTRNSPEAPGARTCAWLTTRGRIVARMDLRDRVRPDARTMLESLREAGIQVRLCSGDHSEAVRALARQLGIADWQGGMTPGDKLEVLRTLQEQGRVVAAVGDGSNDAPFLSAADVSIAMAGGADLARVNADMVLISDALDAIPEALRIGRRTKSIIRQNITWAIGYNLLALPAAAMGAVPPWAAALGMSASSLIVVANALRLHLETPSEARLPQPTLATVPG